MFRVKIKEVDLEVLSMDEKRKREKVLNALDSLLLKQGFTFSKTDEEGFDCFVQTLPSKEKPETEAQRYREVVKRCY
jgi:hypothetical protein